MSAIKCTQCGHENDQTRVFCQNCGTRLERPEGTEAVISGPTESPVKGKPLQQKTKKRKIRQTDGEEVHFLPWLFGRIVGSAFLGFILAVIVQAARTPDGMPAPQTPNEAQANKTFELLRSSSESPYARSYDLTQDQINNYLATHVMAEKANSELPIRAEFQRAFVVVQPESLRVVVQQKQLGWPMYFYLDVAPAATGGGEGTLIGGGIGRIRLSDKFAFLAKRFVKPIFDGLAQNLEPLNKANSVTLAPPVVKLSWSGKKPNP